MTEVRDTIDLQRVRNLPRRRLSERDAAAWAAILTERYACPGSAAALRSWQGIALAEAATYGGAWLALPVGHGKTLITYLLAAVMGATRPILVLPATLRDKTHADFRELAADWGAHPVRVVTLQELAPEGGATLLEQIAPDLIIIDECDELANAKSSAARRIDRYIVAKQDAVRVVAMTGTPGRKSIMNYWHLLCWCLRDAAPVPMTRSEAESWALALDEGRGRFPSRMGVGALGATRSAARQWYRDRLVETPGVIVVDDDSCDAPLTVRVRLAREDTRLDEAFTTFLTTLETPCGIPVTDPLSRWRIDGQLGCGLYLIQYNKNARDQCRASILRSINALSATPIENITHAECAVHATSNGVSPKIQHAQPPKSMPVGLGSKMTPPSSHAFAREITCVISEMLSTVAGKTEPVLWQERAAAIQQSLGNWASAGATVLHASSGRRLSTASTERVGSAYVSEDRKGCVSTTITELGLFAAYCAPDVIARLRLSETQQKVWRELCAICWACSKPPDAWMVARRAVAKLVRDAIASTTHGRAPLDTEAQVLRRYESHPVVTEWWRVKDTFDPVTEPVWITDSTLQSVRDWLAEDRLTPGIVWTGCVEFATALATVTGLAYFGREGRDQHGRGLHTADSRANMIASWHANKRGFNLQAWRRQLIVMPPQSAKYLEQIFGRSHRAGQDAPVMVDVLATSGGTLDAFEAAIAEAGFARATIGMTQKLLRANIVRATPRVTSANRFRWARKTGS